MFQFVIALLISASVQAATPVERACERYSKYFEKAAALQVVASDMGYTVDQMCRLPHLLGLHITETKFLNQNNEWEGHQWITLHYRESSCQYFVRKWDLVVTRKNCYNTF